MENGLTTRQWRLKMFLENNFIPNYFFSIEEIVENVYMPNGTRAYELNKNPRNHDKCIALSNDIREINWNVCEGYKILVKDKKGGVKLCETRQEFEEWRNNELKPLTKKWQYLNNLVWKKQQDGVVPLLNKANNPNTECKVIDVFDFGDDTI